MKSPARFFLKIETYLRIQFGTRNQIQVHTKKILRKNLIWSIIWMVSLKNISDLNVLQFMKMRMDHPSNAKVTFHKTDQSLSIKVKVYLNLKMNFQMFPI